MAARHPGLGHLDLKANIMAVVITIFASLINQLGTCQLFLPALQGLFPLGLGRQSYFKIPIDQLPFSHG